MISCVSKNQQQIESVLKRDDESVPVQSLTSGDLEGKCKYILLLIFFFLSMSYIFSRTLIGV